MQVVTFKTQINSFKKGKNYFNLVVYKNKIFNEST